jgi:DNA polymerase-3 subunit beta
VDDYPLPATISGAEVLIPADVWEAAGKFVGPCVDPTSTRYAMSGFHVTRSEGVLEIAATDGKRMAVLAGPACGEFPAATIRPEVLGMIEGDITATIDNKLAAFQSGNVSVWCQLIEGRFPDYAKAEEGATDGADNQVDVPAEPLLAAFKLVTVTTSEETTGVDVTFGDGKIVIESAAADKGESRSEIPSTADVKATMRLDCKMMADFLKRIPSGESVAVSYGEAAAVVLAYKRVRMVVMGMDR